MGINGMLRKFKIHGLSFLLVFFFFYICSGQWWGKKDIQPIVAVHGWLDNAGSWEPLAKLIPDDYSILAIDIPGHGLSSHIPPFQNYYYAGAVSVIRRIKQHFGFGKLNLLGHSYGSTICFMYAAVFPDHTSSYFGIDFIAWGSDDDAKRVAKLGKIIDSKIQFSLRKHSESREYTWEEARDAWIKGSESSLNNHSAEILMKRGLTKLPSGKYILNRDLRFKGDILNVFTKKQVRKLAENISCHVSLVKGTQSLYFKLPLSTNPDLMDIMKSGSKSFSYHELDGKHHLHMDLPEQFLPLLVDLMKRSAK